MKRFFLLFFFCYSFYIQANNNYVLNDTLDFNNPEYLEKNINFSNVKEEPFDVSSQGIACEGPSLVSFVLPASLIFYGVITHTVPSVRSIDYNIKDARDRNITRKYRMDDYIQYLPLAMTFTTDLFPSVEAKNKIADRAIIAGSSIAISIVITHASKKFTAIPRPDNSAYNSFPSGHTCTAFLGAHLLFREYRKSAPFVAYSGYTLATTVACLRVINNRHWASDVITGAGVGILSVELGYLLYPYIKKLFGESKTINNLSVAPLIDPLGTGVDVTIRF